MSYTALHPDFNELPGFIDFSCALSKTVNFKNQKLYVNLQAANILNKNYEVIKSFPMPGRYYRLKLIYNLWEKHTYISLPDL